MKLLQNFKLSRFLKLDLRWKLKRIEKKLGIRLYPKYFEFRGIKNIYSYLIFNLLFFEKVFQAKKINFHKLKNINENDNQNINFIYCLPSSGSNYVRNLLSSYFELRYNIGNGIPKFDSYSDNKWIYNDSPIISPDLFNNIFLDDNINRIDSKFYNKSQYLKERVGMSRYPLRNVDLFKIERTNPLIILRHPNDWITSVYFKKSNDSFYSSLDKDVIVKKLTRDMIRNYLKFCNFWISHLKKRNKNEFLILKFEDLVKEDKEIFLKILNFFKIEIDDSKIEKSLYFNSKDYVFSQIQGKKSSRFVDPLQKQKIKQMISEEIKEEFKNYNVVKIYDDFLDLSNS